MKKLILALALLIPASLFAAAAPTPGGSVGVALNPSNAFAFLNINAQGALLLAQLGPGGSPPTPAGSVGIALDPSNNFAFLHVDSSGGLITSGGAASGPITTSGLTESTATMLGRTTAGTGAIEELSASAVKTFLTLSNVENTAISTWAGSTNVTTLGTISTGTWSATTIATTKGGTGLTSFTSGGLMQATSTSALTTTLTPAGITSIGVNGISSAAATALTIGTSTFGTSITIASATGIPTFATVQLAPAGAVGGPSYSFTAEPTMGMYRRGAGLLSFAAAGLRGMTVDGNAFTVNMDFAILAVNGSVGAPAVAGPGQTAGFYFPSGTSIAASTNGVLAMTISSTQNTTFTGTLATAGPTGGNGNAAIQLGTLRTGVALAASTTTGWQVNVGGTLVTLAVLSTNP